MTKKNKNKNKNVTNSFKKMISVGSASELLQTAIDQVSKTKGDISSLVTGEIISLIRKIDIVSEFSKFAEDHKFKISMDIEISKKDKEK